MFRLSRICILRNRKTTFKISVQNISDGNVVPERMSAWQVHSYGGIDALSFSDSVRVPPIKDPQDVLIEIAASSVNPIDVAMMGGYGATLLNIGRRLKAGFSTHIEFPLVLGRDFSGKIVEKGHGVDDNFKIGDEVWGVVSPFNSGCHAQYVICSASNIHRKPSNLNEVEAAALLYAAITAWSALKISGDLCLQASRGKRVLVLGGSGGVGSSAIQMLKAWGAQVVTTCSGDAMPLVESFGADHVIDYHDPNAENLVMQTGKYDIILNAAGMKSPQFLDALKERGCSKYVTATSPLLRNVDQHGLPLGMMKNVFELVSSNLSLRRTPFFLGGPSVRWAFFIPFSKAIEEITELASSGKLTPVVEKVFKFSELPAAYQKILDGHSRGKTVIDVRSG